MTNTPTTPDAVEPAHDNVFDVGALKIGAVYAKAYLGAAETAGKTEAAVAEFDSLVTDVLDHFPQLESVLGSSVISADKKEQILDRTLGKQASPLLLNFLKVLSQHERLDCLRPIRRAIHEQYDEMRGRVRVGVTTAAPIDDAQAGRIADALRSLLGSEPVIERSVQPDLIGGLVLRVGDMVYDGSVTAQLAHVREQMIDRSVHEIQSRRDSFRYPTGS